MVRFEKRCLNIGKNVCFMDLNVWYSKGRHNHVIRSFENWKKVSEKWNVQISGVTNSDGYCTSLVF